MTEPTDEPVRLGDRYELGGMLGKGGMADVRLGRDLRLGRAVAVKQLKVDLASDDTFQERFRREAQSAAALNHPSIVAVYDTGEGTDAHGNHIPYIVMEYVEGQTLREILRDDRKILPERALNIAADVLSALDYSHRAGIIHRDIKPANVMLTPSGQVKVMDFGIARAIADASSAMTQTAAVIGTAQYLSPEQARGETVDARSDIYSTGCLLYELLTGRPPFVGESPVSVAYQHVREEARPPSQLNPDVPASVDNIIAKSLAKRVDDRYQSAADMRRDIERVLGGQAVGAPTMATAVAGATAVAAPIVTPTPARAAEPEPEQPGYGKWIALALVLLLLLGVGGFALFQSNQPDPVAQSEIPSVVGKSQDAATRQLESAGFVVGDVSQEASADVAEGDVISQDPSANSMADDGSTVNLVVSSGPDMVQIGNVQGFTYDEAKDLFDGLGLKVEREERSNSQTADTVINTNPPAGTMVAPGSTVTVFVSTGAVTVPNVVNSSEDEARSTLEDAGLKVTTEEDGSSTAPKGTVTSQSPTAGQTVPPDTEITITVSTYEAPEPTASPTTTDPAAGADGDTGDGTGGQGNG